MPMISRKPKDLPSLVVGSQDSERLISLAESISAKASDIADQLFTELDRARIVEQSKIPIDTIRMGSTVSFSASDGTDRTLQLVYPGDADISLGKISVLTPIGVALIGLRKGQSIPWSARDGRCLCLTVNGVQ
jgi:regulator of nucleoside diphosphate kinase